MSVLITVSVNSGTGTVKLYKSDKYSGPWTDVSSSDSFSVGEWYKIQATPGSGYYFNRWVVTDYRGSSVGYVNPTIDQVSENDTVIFYRAEFSQSTPSVYTVQVLPCRLGTTDQYSDAYGSATVSPASGSAGTTITATCVPASGYQFSNWEWAGVTQVSGYGPYTNPTKVKINSNPDWVGIRPVVTAVPTYTITTSVSPTSSGTIVGSGTYSQNSTCTLTVTPATGYHFVNWTEGGSAVIADNPWSFTVTGNRTLVANLAKDTYAVKYYGNGNTGGTVPSQQTKTYGTALTLSSTVLTKTSSTGNAYTVTYNSNGGSSSPSAQTSTYTTAYTHDGWATSASGAKAYNLGGSYTTNAAIDLYAHWTSSTTYGSIILPSPGTKTNYTFAGWYSGNTRVGGSGDSYTPSSNVALTANWTLITYTISFNANGGSGSQTSGTKNSGEAYVLPACNFTAPANKRFSGNWKLNSASGTSYAVGSSYTTNAAATFYADWEYITYTVSTSVSPTGSGTVSGSGTKNSGSSCTVSATAGTGYNFVNWTENGTQVSTSASYTFTVSGNRNLVANFTLQTFAVTVSASTGGSVSGGNTYTYGSTATVYATPLTGYQFSNWTENDVVVSTSSTYSFTVSSARTLVANFIAASSDSDGLLLWLPLTTGIVDQSLSNTIMTNHSCTSSTNGKLGNCYTFTGSSYINGTLSNFNKDCWSVACWVLATASSSSGHQYMVSLNGSTASDFTFTLCWYQNKFGVRTGDTTYSSDITGLTSVWTHVCATYENSTLKIYINGVLNKTVSSPKAPVAASGLFLGMRGGSAGYFTGSLNDVRVYNYTLSQKEVSEISKGLILHYKLNRVNSNGYTYDCSGNGHKGSNTGSLTTSASTPRYNKSTICSGSNYISTTSPTTEAKTFSVWANWDSIPSGQSIIYVDLKSKTGLGLMSSGILCSCNGLNSNTFSKSSISASTWYHFVVVCPNGGSDASRKLYINGVEQTSTTSTSNWTFSLDQLQVGKRSTTSDGFAGKLSDFRIYATALSDADIQELYNTSMTIDDNGNTLPRELFESVGDNFFTSEKIQSYAFNITSSNNHGQWVDRNGQAAMKISPSNAFYANSTYAHIFEGLFEEDTSYVFDMYIDADDAFYNGSYRNGGFRIYYSDDTSYTGFIVTGGDGVGFQHKTFITPADKTVSYITINYNVNNPIYYRWGSTITKYDTAFITKTGLFEPTQLIEGNNLSSLIEGGEEYCNKLEEY